jgi:hypothetical protein
LSARQPGRVDRRVTWLSDDLATDQARATHAAARTRWPGWERPAGRSASSDGRGHRQGTALGPLHLPREDLEGRTACSTRTWSPRSRCSTPPAEPSVRRLGGETCHPPSATAAPDATGFPEAGRARRVRDDIAQPERAASAQQSALWGKWERLWMTHSADNGMGHSLRAAHSVIVDDGLLIRLTVPQPRGHLDGMQEVKVQIPSAPPLIEYSTIRSPKHRAHCLCLAEAGCC